MLFWKKLGRKLSFYYFNNFPRSKMNLIKIKKIQGIWNVGTICSIRFVYYSTFLKNYSELCHWIRFTEFDYYCGAKNVSYCIMFVRFLRNTCMNMINTKKSKCYRSFLICYSNTLNFIHGINRYRLKINGNNLRCNGDTRDF